MSELPTASREGPIEAIIFETIERLQPIGVTRIVENVMIQIGASDQEVRAALARMTLQGDRIFYGTNLQYYTTGHDPLKRLLH